MKQGIIKIHYTSSLELNGYFLVNPDSKLSLRQQLIRSFLAKGRAIKWFSKYDKILIKCGNEYMICKPYGNRSPIFIWMNEKDIQRLHELETETEN